ncbi:MAG: hypothetical protein ACEQSR_15155 [Candidatus Methylacidiphilales bacterium]
MNFKDFKDNPIMYILYLPITAMFFLLILVYNTSKARLKDRDISIQNLENSIEKKDLKIEKQGEKITALYELLQTKKILDSLK